MPYSSATGQEALTEDETMRPVALATLGALAADCAARAVARGVWLAEGWTKCLPIVTCFPAD